MNNFKNEWSINNSLLKEADSILTSRGADYPDPVVNFKNISAMVNLMGENISPIGCAKVLIALKLVREGYKHKKDNLVDAISYIDILNRIIEDNLKNNI